MLSDLLGPSSVLNKTDRTNQRRYLDWSVDTRSRNGGIVFMTKLCDATETLLIKEMNELANAIPKAAIAIRHVSREANMIRNWIVTREITSED